MTRMTFSRRTLCAAVAALACLPSVAAFAAPFASSRISVQIEGSGPDVVLIPGLNSSPRAWASTVAAMPGYRYHLVQLAGFGGAPAAGNKAGDVVAPVAEEIARYLSEAGLKRPAVIGHSMGGTIGLMLAARHPDALARLMVVDMVPALGAMFAGPDATPAQVEAVADRIALAMRSASPAQRRASAAVTINGMVDNLAMRPVALHDVLASDPDVGTRAFHELLLTNLGPELGKITVPVSVLYVQTRGVPMTPEQFDAVYQSVYAPIAGVTLKRIANSAHFIMWDQPQRFQSEAKAFLGPR
ncbi:alpha/beta fold hydrolase [Massilia sp. S19_KUP03_FR1]|uniref:alpha/beta fold hydrolase n=1 Tax=Massilia sp. S19_KUP03_FR1 TaxID=3025503 RepID=UPI002FCD7413